MSTDLPIHATRLDAYFQHVLDVRMRDLPIVNASLQVESCGWQPHESGWLGVLITPWCMNLVLFEDASSAESQSESAPPVQDMRRIGESCLRTFPAGAYEFTVNREDEVGTWLSCSLFSPMVDFPEQSFARDVAEKALQALFEPAETTAATEANASEAAASPLSTEPAPPDARPPAPMSRREWFRAALKRDTA